MVRFIGVALVGAVLTFPSAGCACRRTTESHDGDVRAAESVRHFPDHVRNIRMRYRDVEYILPRRPISDLLRRVVSEAQIARPSKHMGIGSFQVEASDGRTFTYGLYDGPPALSYKPGPNPVTWNEGLQRRGVERLVLHISEADYAEILGVVRDTAVSQRGCSLWPDESIGVEAVSELVAAADAEDVLLRRLALSALKNLDAKAEEEAIPALVHALDDPDRFCREIAAEALGAIGPNAKDAVPALTDALSDDYEAVRDRAREALHQIDQNWQPKRARDKQGEEQKRDK